jgi:hypothetical protein
MNNRILQAIETLCTDIVASAEAEENQKRANAVLDLAFAGMLTSREPEMARPVAGAGVGAEKDKIKFPKPGERFEYNGVMFTVLGEEQGGVLAIVSELLLQRMPFDKSSKNDWRISSLRKHLNGEYLEQFNRGDLLPFGSDLTADDGMKDYGTAEDYVFLLSCDLYRKYREFVPRFKHRWSTLTPWTCTTGSYLMQAVSPGGTVVSDFASIHNCVAPAVLFNPRVFE